MAEKQKLTPTQAAFFKELQNYINEHTISPTYEELGELVGISKVNARGMCKRLEARGYIRTLPHKCRTISVV